MAKHNKYKQKADEHPHPHIDVPMKIFSELLFRERDNVLGFFVRAWCHAVWKKNARFIGKTLLEDLAPGMTKLALEAGFLTSVCGELFLTGPLKDPAWLGELPKSWWTYAIEAHGQNAVKIGRSLVPARRLEELQSAASVKLSLLGTVNKDIEAELHELLSSHRRDGEWFTFNEEVRAALMERGMMPLGSVCK